MMEEETVEEQLKWMTEEETVEERLKKRMTEEETVEERLKKRMTEEETVEEPLKKRMTEEETVEERLKKTMKVVAAIPLMDTLINLCSQYPNPSSPLFREFDSISINRWMLNPLLMKQLL
ncbi:hypothetical protein AAHA92_13507 [Salvia divinorum]|uniref:Uncharacterized protein n=1 Tax=Salvia divinorum TaxID=28513 RepID=A0ABD1HCC1_SALDI